MQGSTSVCPFYYSLTKLVLGLAPLVVFILKIIEKYPEAHSTATMAKLQLSMLFS